MFHILAASLTFGITMVLPIGGADMPVVISLLNSFTGTAVAMAGFVLGNDLLIIAGALVGASGAILTKLMADAMNRSVMNIMIGGFGGGEGGEGGAVAGGGSVRSIGADDVAIQLAYAQHVIVVPGYGTVRFDCNATGQVAVDYTNDTNNIPVRGRGSRESEPDRLPARCR